MKMVLSSTVIVVLSCANAFAVINREAPRVSTPPTIDGVISAAEASSQLVIPMSWPAIGTAPERGTLLVGSAPSAAALSGTFYVSWDNSNLYLSADVLDDTPSFTLDSQGGHVSYNAQDVWQPVFNPNNNRPFAANGDPCDPACEGDAGIWDVVVDTSDGFGPDIYRHGPQMSDPEWASIAIAGTKTGTAGYVLETAIPWATAMDDAGYVPTVNDVHGLGFILLSFGGSNSPILYTDFGNGDNTSNTIGDTSTWNTITLVPEPSAVALLSLGVVALGARRRRCGPLA